jgi:dolichyl-diphosphooligosaccharide--protein glycosyltransferase
MVAAWGGYIFVLNMVALHAAATVVLDWISNRYDPCVTKAYGLFFVIGTGIAIRVPPVGMTPFKSLEQLFALLVFIFICALHYSEILRKKADVEIISPVGFRIRAKVFLMTCGALFLAALVLAPTGFFGPLSSRVRGLFVQHTRTGNPLVDSVAEHQPASADAYWHYLHYCCQGWQLGMLVLPYLMTVARRSATSFLFLYGVVAYYFSLRMARLIILSAAVASACSGIVVGLALDWATGQLFWSERDNLESQRAAEGKDAKGKPLTKKNEDRNSLENSLKDLKRAYIAHRHARVAAALLLFAVLLSRYHWTQFETHAERMAMSFANPQLMFKSQLSNGQVVVIDDYREAYHWLRDKTPEDSRVMAWWDYGYQITGIGNRTSIADGNTWNHEHIATLGKCLTSPVKEAHSLIRHLADYVLVWAGGGGDDLAKSPHMARIGNSVVNFMSQ